jgi:hypothetical protein
MSTAHQRRQASQEARNARAAQERAQTEARTEQQGQESQR